MKIDTFFIVNVLLMLALIAGASYLQKAYDPEQHGEEVSTQTTAAAPAGSLGGWQVSTTSATATTNASTNTTVAPVQTTPAPPAKAPAPKPAVHRVYNEEGNDD